MKQSDLVIPQGKLGKDLPNKEEELFHIDHYPLFDMEFAIDILGNETVVKEIFQSFYEDNEKDLQDIKTYFDSGDLEGVRRLSHKLKSSSLYGTLRLQLALLFLERYLHAGHTRCVEPLYTQMLEVMDLTCKELEKRNLIAK
jgi:HPt (histidine-containing phosphotransfer) domain-containing protein